MLRHNDEREVIPVVDPSRASKFGLILMANGFIEARFHLVLSGFETFQAKALVDLRIDGRRILGGEPANDKLVRGTVVGQCETGVLSVQTTDVPHPLQV